MSWSSLACWSLTSSVLRQQHAYGVVPQRSARSMQCDASHAEVHDVVASRNVSSDIAIVEARRRGEMRQHLEHRGASLRRSSCRARVAGRTAGTSRRPAAAGGTPAEVGLRPGEDFSFFSALAAVPVGALSHTTEGGAAPQTATTTHPPHPATDVGHGQRRRGRAGR